MLYQDIRYYFVLLYIYVKMFYKKHTGLRQYTLYKSYMTSLFLQPRATLAWTASSSSSSWSSPSSPSLSTSRSSSGRQGERESQWESFCRYYGLFNQGNIKSIEYKEKVCTAWKRHYRYCVYFFYKDIRIFKRIVNTYQVFFCSFLWPWLAWYGLTWLGLLASGIVTAAVMITRDADGAEYKCEHNLSMHFSLIGAGKIYLAFVFSIQSGYLGNGLTIHVYIQWYKFW